MGLFLRRAAIQGPIWSQNVSHTPDVGSVSFGSIDEAHTEGELQWITADGLWNVRLDNLTLNGVTANVDLVRRAKPVDVGASYMWPLSDGDWGERLIGITLNQPFVGLPSAMVDGLMSTVPGAAKWNRTSAKYKPETFWSVPCDAKLDFSVTLNGTMFSMAAEDLIMREENGNCTALFSSVVEDGTWKSVPFLGLPFLRTVYSVWDLQNQCIGFSEVKNEGELLNMTTFASPLDNFSTVPVQPTTTGRIYGEKHSSSTTKEPTSNGDSSRVVVSLTLFGASAIIVLVFM